MHYRFVKLTSVEPEVILSFCAATVQQLLYLILLYCSGFSVMPQFTRRVIACGMANVRLDPKLRTVFTMDRRNLSPIPRD